jgi:hypothetical protein
VRLERRYRSSEEAGRIWRSVSVDNPAFLRGGARGNHLVIEVAGESAGSLRATLDDLLACLGAAERAGAKDGRAAHGSVRVPVLPK